MLIYNLKPGNSRMIRKEDKPHGKRLYYNKSLLPNFSFGNKLWLAHKFIQNTRETDIVVE